MLAHEVFDPKNTPPMFKYRHLPLYYVVIIYCLPHFSLCKMGVIIPIGRMDYVRPQRGINHHVIP
jgi:hypothetical protein